MSNDEKISLGFMEQKNAAHEARLIEKLSGDDTRLKELEEVIRRGLSKFLEVGEALLEIRNSKLYRQAGHATFEFYCHKRWGMSRFYAHRLIDSAEVVTNLLNWQHPPTRERGTGTSTDRVRARTTARGLETGC